MGFRDWLSNKRRRTSIEPDAIWLSAAARLAGLCEKTVVHALDARVVVLAHFPQMLDSAAEALGGRLGHERADSAGDIAAWLTSPCDGNLVAVGQRPAGAGPG